MMLGIVAVLGCSCAAWGSAAELVVRVGDARGRPVADAVVTVVPRTATEANAAPSASPATKVIDQRDETYLPYVEVFRPGDKVVFRNSDTTRHHVYSFAPTKSFEFVLRPGEASDPMVLDRNGIVAIGCNIHDPMIAYLFVSNAALVARTGAAGVVKFANLAAGAYVVRVWHPQLRPGRAPAAKSLAIAATDTTTSASFALALLPDPRGPQDRERAKY